jgi:hypothetical protein
LIQRERLEENRGFEPSRRINLEQAIMKVVKAYSTSVDADVAKIALAAAGLPSVVVGIGTELEGGAAGVQLLVPDEYVEAALKVLEGS